MIVEVIAVGTELLIGQIANTNATFIGARLAEEGFDAHYQVTVGDNLLTGWSRRSEPVWPAPMPSSSPGESGRPRTT